MRKPCSLFAVGLLTAALLATPTAIAGPLDDAAISGDVAALKRLLDEGANPNGNGTPNVPTPLFFAAERGNLAAVDALLDSGADVNALTSRGSALHIAARRGRTEIVETLLRRGADPNLLGGDKMTRPLHEAAAGGSLETVILLLDQGADVNARTGYKGFRGEAPAIHLAALNGHDDVAALLRERGFQPWTPEPIAEGELAAADLALGKEMAVKCTPCHTYEPGKVGKRAASLWNIVGQKKASNPDFAFSPAMASQTGVWDYEELNRYLADAYGSVPGTSSYFTTIRDRAARIAAIAYLRTMADDPVPLP